MHTWTRTLIHSIYLHHLLCKGSMLSAMGRAKTDSTLKDGKGPCPLISIKMEWKVGVGNPWKSRLGQAEEDPPRPEELGCRTKAPGRQAHLGCGARKTDQRACVLDARRLGRPGKITCITTDDTLTYLKCQPASFFYHRRPLRVGCYYSFFVASYL